MLDMLPTDFRKRARVALEKAHEAYRNGEPTLEHAFRKEEIVWHKAADILETTLKAERRP
jgi:hypothetical protein